MLRVHNLTKVFNKGTPNEKVALDQVSFNLDQGEFVTIIGGNGSGKSTLFQCISGALQVDQGSIHLDSREITYEPEYKRSLNIGRVFQNPNAGTANDLTIEENLAIAHAKGKQIGLSFAIRRNEQALYRDYLASLGMNLENRMKQKVGLLSGGQRQALTLLMAIIVKPKLLLLDEHTAALDPSAARNVLEITRNVVHTHELCTLMVTHNMKDALENGTRTIMMSGGRIILDYKGKERETLTAEKLLHHFI